MQALRSGKAGFKLIKGDKLISYQGEIGRHGVKYWKVNPVLGKHWIVEGSKTAFKTGGNIVKGVVH